MEAIYSFGYWVMRRRKALDLTRDELAQQVSCSPETIKKIERDERRPSRQMATLLAEALAVPGAERDLFLVAARGERPVDGLPVVIQPLPSGAPPHNLPPQPTAFVGREAELAALGAYLADPAIRLITILGPGGMGKTRLALAAAEIQARANPQHPFPNGVYFFSLAPLNAPEQLLPAIAEAVGFRFYPGGKPWQQLIDYLRHKRILLLLDNFEHLKTAAGMASEMLAAAPGLKALVTSRERLDLMAEQIYPIGGLSLPDVAADGMQTNGDWDAYEAIRLFALSARRVQPGFELTEVNRPHVAEICRLVGGAPLGIVLAASWLGALPAEQIVAEMRRDLHFLATEMADLPERHRSLRAAFEHSWLLLTLEERAVLRRLSVFRGGFNRAAAAVVAEASLPDLLALVNKSLLIRTGERYDVHELLRQFAAEKLSEAPDDETATLDRHSAYYCAFLRDLNNGWHNAEQLEALVAVTREMDNVRPALQWALERDAWQSLIEAVDSWARYLEWQGLAAEGISFCRVIAAQAEARDRAGMISLDCLRLWATALNWMSLFNMHIDDFYSPASELRQSLTLLERPELAQQDVRRERAFAHLVWSHGPQDGEWRRHLEQCLTLYRELDEPWAVAEALGELASADWWVEGHLKAGLEKLEAAHSIQQRIRDRRAQIKSLGEMALVHKCLGHLDEAERMQREGLRLSLELGERNFLVDGYVNLAFTLCWQGQYTEAIHLAETGWAIAQELGQNSVFMIEIAIGNNLIHAGQYEEVRRHLDLIFPNFTELAPPSANRMLCEVLGELALAESALIEGQKALLRSVELSRESSNHLLGQSLGNLALADYHLNQLPQARKHLAETLLGAMANENYMSAVFALPGVALLLAASGDVIRAVEVWALAQRTPIMANSRYYEDLAWREIAQAAVSLPPDVIEAARERGRTLDMWATAAELLAYLDNKN